MARGGAVFHHIAVVHQLAAADAALFGQPVEGLVGAAGPVDDDVGPFLASNLKTPSGSIAKALSVRVGDSSSATSASVCKWCINTRMICNRTSK